MSDQETKTPATTEPTVDQEEKKATETEETNGDVDKVCFDPREKGLLLAYACKH